MYKQLKYGIHLLKLNNMGDYHDLYLKADALLLANVFENFRKTCMRYYKLDPCHILQVLGYLGYNVEND